MDPQIILKRSDRYVVFRFDDRKVEVQLVALPGDSQAWQLYVSALNGNEEAAAKLAKIAHEAVSLLTLLAEEKPDVLRPHARCQVDWPVFKTLHPARNYPHEQLFRSLQLAADLPEYADAASRYPIDNAASIAFALIRELDTARRGADQFRTNAFIKQAVALPKYSRDTAADWWAIAKARLLETYPEPLDIPELASLVTSKARTKFKSRHRASIFKIIRERFVAMAPP